MTGRSVARSARAGRFGYWLALGWSAALLWACDVQPEEAPRVPAPAGAKVLTEHRPLTAASPPSKSVGEDCTTYGRSECVSGICLHVKPQPGAGYFCSQTCRDLEECPEGWRCARLMPGGSEDGVCQPPSSWVSAVASP
ncbi:hypothetical protein [Hyalangium sp.]|uniref:hypothetical protein n=1 Tax=Hyalangium sp. TaxID=2028555 RepID=UPI002D26CA17|nr:hypothetical protein [Hyalangium sp.]HYI02787.1 hypothetical protein [Hyalangium sp.]